MPDLMSSWMPTMTELKLQISLIPSPLHGRNLRKKIGKKRWNRIRDGIKEEEGPICEICGDTSDRIHGHEEWEYDTSTTPAVATLKRIGLVCWKCHGVHHYGLAVTFARQGHTDQLQQITEHFCRINGVDETALVDHLSDALRRFGALNELEWAIDYGAYYRLIGIREAAQAKWLADRAKRAAKSSP